MGKQIDKNIVEQIPILYKKINNKTKVAKELGISVATVNKYLKIYEAAPIAEKPKGRTTITKDIEEQINKRYQECKNMSQVAKEFGIAVGTVKNHLNEKSLKIKDNINNDRDALFFYIYRLFGQYSENEPVSKWNITQMQKFKNQGYTYQGQLLTLKYFFEVKKSSIQKSNGSIGIIPWIYEESKQYYINQAKRADAITEAIQKQLEKDRIEIKINPSDYFGRKKKKKTIDLNSIEG